MIDPELTKKFFLESDSDQLRKIHGWAESRQAASWALFGSVLPRVAALTPFTVQLPPVIGDYASLNIFCATVALSGGGKGKADRVGKRAYPADINVVQPGSGEGLAEMFTDRRDKPRLDSAIINANEIDAVAALVGRQGANLLPELKSAWMGEPLGQNNASKATSRHVDEHDYRLCLSVGAQYGHAGVIFSDTTGGSPQRFYWWPGTDPNMPRGTGDDPPPLDTTMPVWEFNHDGVAAIAYDPDTGIEDTIRDNDLARNRGEGDALDGHAILARCKLAALIAIMHQRQNVTVSDWELSGIAMQVSDQTRKTMLDYDRHAARAKVRDRAVARADGDDLYDTRRMDNMKKSVLRALERYGEQAEGKIASRYGNAEKRHMARSALPLLEEDGLARSRKGEYNGAATTYWSPLTQRVTPQNACSEGVTGRVTPDPNGKRTATEKPSSTPSDTSHEGAIPDPTPTPEETVKPPRSARQIVSCKCGTELPAAATSDVCDFCDGAPPPKEPPAPKPPPVVVHNGRYAKKNGGLESIRYTTAPNGMPPQQTHKETA